MLLTLGAFGLLMNHYQDQVVGEVAKTASDVTKATLRTLNFGEHMALNTFLAESEDRAIRHGAGTDAGGHALPYRQQIVMLRGPGAPPCAEELREIERPAGVEGESGVWVAEADEYRTVEVIHHRIECDSDEPGDERCAELRKVAKREIAVFGAASTGSDGQVFIGVEDVHVESDPTAGHLTLKIPTFGLHEGNSATGTIRYEFVTDNNPAAGVLLAKHDDIELPISVADYQELYQSFRGRSLFMFLGVFLVGMALTTGLASRFTRPIRKLDAGLRRLSDGDLDVEVDAQGKDEIARLGRAFNEMTRKLREGRDRNREMVRREKLSALGGLAAGVAHDVRNPLHSIGLTLQHLGESCRPESAERSEDFDQSIDIIRGEIRRLDQLVGSFLRFSRNERSERQPVDLAELLNETHNLIRKEAEWRGIEVELDVNAAVPAVSADEEGIRSSILNLVLNSFEAMPDGGKLSLKLTVDGDSLIVEVADNGRGIPEELQEKVFEFAYTTREGGSGLGLATVHQCIVEEHGGRVTLDSCADRGTCVRLALPIRPPEREEQA